MTRYQRVALALADAMLAGTPDPSAYAERCSWALGRNHRWIKPLCRRAFRRFGSGLDHRDRAKLADWIRGDEGYSNAWWGLRGPRIARCFLDPPKMAPRTGALAACDIPSLPTTDDLASWLAIAPNELDW